jgi:predicted dehydrogenase
VIRVGIAGFGLAGRVFHAPLVAAVDGLELSVVVTSDAGRGEQARAAHPGVQVVASVDDAWPELDVLVVATPNRVHASLALEAIAREVPVVVDKPFAVTSADAERVLEAGGRVTVFQNRRWDGDFLTAQRLVEDGTLGRVTRLESRFERFRPEIKEGWRELGAPEEGGGQLFDLGAHLVDQATVLFGDPVRVYAEVAAQRSGAAVDDDAFVALEHPGGVRSHLWMGAVAPLAGPRLRLSGLGGGFACDGLDPQEGQLADGLRPGDAGYGERGPGRLVGPDGAEREQPLEPGRYESFYAGVRAWLEDGAPAPVDPHDSLTGLRVLEAARASAAAHDVIDLEDPT